MRKHGVQAGDELFIQEDQKTLVITPENTSQILRIEIDGSKLLPRLVDRFMARSYQKGYDEILFIHNNPLLLETIKTKVHELIGYEVVEEDAQKCLIKSITGKIELDFDHSLQRAFLLVKLMLEECQQYYQQGNLEALEKLEDKDLEVNRMTYFCLRQINKEHYESKERTQQLRVLYYLVEILEDLGDAVKKLAKCLAKTERKELFILFLHLAQEQYACSLHYFYKPSVDSANRAFVLYQEGTTMVGNIASNHLNPYEILSLMNLQDIMNIIYHFTTMRLDYLKR